MSSAWEKPTSSLLRRPNRKRRFCWTWGARPRFPCRNRTSRPKPRPRYVAPEVPDPSDALAVLNWTMYGLMKGTLDVKAAGQLIYSVQQMLTH